MVRRLFLSLAAAALASGAGACAVTTTSVTVSRTIEQSALMPALTGPRATGALVHEGLFAFEAGYTAAPVLSQKGARWEGAPGELSIEHELRARLAYGASDKVEIGINVGFASASWATGRATDTTGQDLPGFMAHGGPTGRFLFFRNERLGVGALVELDFALVPYVSSVYDKAWASQTTVSVGPWWLDVNQRNQYIGERKRYLTESEFYPAFRGGMFVTIDAAEWVTINLGALGQNALTFVGAETVTFTCTGANISPAECAEREAPDLPRSRYEPVLTLFASASFSVEPMVFTAHLFAHPAAPDVIRDTTPFGVDLSARVEF